MKLSVIFSPLADLLSSERIPSRYIDHPPACFVIYACIMIWHVMQLRTFIGLVLKSRYDGKLTYFSIYSFVISSRLKWPCIFFVKHGNLAFLWSWSLVSCGCFTESIWWSDELLFQCSQGIVAAGLTQYQAYSADEVIGSVRTTALFGKASFALWYNSLVIVTGHSLAATGQPQ